jgi:solute carrier family 25 carnitine/acylcarnitine transporter 20/29
MAPSKEGMGGGKGPVASAVSAADQSFIRRTTKNSLAGTAAGIAGCLVGHPFDTLKVRLQTQPVDKPVYRGLADCFMKTMKWEGIGGLYRGVGSPIVGQMFFRATLFTSFYQFTALLADKDHPGQRLASAKYFLAGSMTGFVAAFVEGPIDLLKTKMQIEIIRMKGGGTPRYRNVFHAGRVIFHEFGFRGLFQGVAATSLRDTPACGIYFGFYELIKDMHAKRHGSDPHKSPAWVVWVAAGTAGFLYWFLTYPTDVIKSSMQSDESDRSRRRFRSIPDCARKLYIEDGGWRRFFRGFTPCLMRAIPANITMLYVVEVSRHFLDPYL